MNKVILIGRLCKDPELKFTAGAGVATATFTLAVDRNYKKEGQPKEADFISCRAWRGLAETIANNLTKGRLIGVSGSIQTGKFTAQDGSTRYYTEVVIDEMKFLDHGNKQQGQQQGAGFGDSGTDDFFPIEGDDDIPF